MGEFRVYARRLIAGESRKCFFSGKFSNHRKAQHWCRNNLGLFGRRDPLVIVWPDGREEDFVPEQNN